MIVLKDKLDEQKGHIALMEKSNIESFKFQNQIGEVTRKLSEQILGTEEFKTLYVHLKELKDKAEAECLLAREKKGPEGPSFAVQGSLPIAFTKEKCETKLQELRQQLSISKKHGEEMLWKLQDVNDLEDR
ncbi:Centromere-associated protein E [Heracleum sosnowskyi]|uniref:Centromere-associated protein E n=1 Tax=Heracleum sosnowskyi TaxID=360622 RepID=A0AAD8J7T8_9APIA|nr:Centromere-associated protein E [Heracleum sosnowskyi]